MRARRSRPGRPPWRAALLGLVIAVLAAGLAACGVPSDDAPRAIDPAVIPEPLLGTVPDTAPPSTPTGVDLPVYVLITDAEESRRLTPFPVSFTQPSPTPRDLLETLLAPIPLDNEQLSQAIPPDVRLVDYRESGDTATVALSEEFAQAQGETLRLAVAQLVYTTTELGTVSEVQFELDGELIPVPTDDGTLRRVVGRADYNDYRPLATS